MTDHASPPPAAVPALMPPALLEALSRNWWLLLLRGIAAIVFGILAVLWPGLTVLTLVILYGAYMLVDGVLSLWAAITGRVEMGSRWWLALLGVLGIIAGLAAFIWPAAIALVLVLFIGAWSVVSGILQIAGAIRLRKEIDNEWMLILSGVLSVLFGIAVMVLPVAGALALVWLIAFYAIVFGGVMVALALRLRKHQPPDITTEAAA